MMKISGGKEENGIVVGNAYDKYNSNNPIVKWMMSGFHNSLSHFVNKASPRTIHEIGCGEGYWVLRWIEENISARGCDVSSQVIELAKDNAESQGFPLSVFEVRSIYDIDANRDSADLIVCCEVLEHLQYPELALKKLSLIVNKHLILSVPQEPLWCVLNLVRGKYISKAGNTPGHIQHWSNKEFVSLVSKYFEILEVKTPLPWTMFLCRPKL